jgi:hypothetical protein
LAIVFLGSVLFWIDGSVPFGSFNPLIIISGLATFYWLVLYRYLTRVGSRSLTTFRPLLAVDDSELALIDYELGNLPSRLGWLVIPIGLVSAAATVLSEPEPFGDLIPQTALPHIVDIIITTFLFSTFYCLVIRSIRQLRMVRKLHSQATNVSILKLEPVHAFSALTARTGVGVLLILIFGYFSDSQPLGCVVIKESR